MYSDFWDDITDGTAVIVASYKITHDMADVTV